MSDTCRTHDYIQPCLHGASQRACCWCYKQCGLPARCAAPAPAQGVQYSLRATTARYRYLALPEMRALMKDVSEALRVL